MRANLRQTLAAAPSDGRLSVVNQGVGAATAVLPFHVNEFAE
jgi:hypothetical protein